jgi:O-antigen/teichoic acid export membrane protein
LLPPLDPPIPSRAEDPGAARGSAVPRRVWGGTGLLVLGRLWGSLCTLVVLFVLARNLAGEDFGRFTFYLAIFALLDSLADLGTGAIAVQRTADAPQDVPEVLAAARRIRVGAGLIGALLVGGGALLFEEPGAGWILLATLYPISHALELSATVFKNRIAWGVPVAVRVFASTLALGVVLGLVAGGVRDPALILLGQVSGHATANLLLFLLSRRHLPARRARSVPWRGLFAAALPLGLAGLCQQAYFYLDNLFVRAIEGEVALGHYNVGVRVLSYTIMIAVYASLAALPWLTRCHTQGRLGEAAVKLVQPLFALAGLGAGLLWPWTELLLGLFGPGFEAAAASLRWLLCATAVIYAGAGLLTAVVATGRTRVMLAITASGLLVNVVGNTLLVPAFGIEGAAMATLATEVSVALLAGLFLARTGSRPFAHRPWAWLAGPALFALAAYGSGQLGLDAWGPGG